MSDHGFIEYFKLVDGKRQNSMLVEHFTSHITSQLLGPKMQKIFFLRKKAF